MIRDYYDFFDLGLYTDFVKDNPVVDPRLNNQGEQPRSLQYNTSINKQKPSG